MNVHVKQFLLILFLIGNVFVCIASRQNVRQSVHDLSAFVTLDFSSFFRVKVPVHKKAMYETGLLELLDSRIGVYQSELFDTAPVEEWRNVSRLQLAIDSSANVTVQGIRPDGTILDIPKCSKGFISDSDIFLGQYESGFLFIYTILSNTIYSVFSPNGVQIPIRFNKIGELPKCGCLPSSRPGLMDFLQLKETMPMQPSQSISGWYKSLTMPEVFRTQGVNEYYLKIGKSYDYFQLAMKDGRFWYDDNLFDSSRMNQLCGPHGRYVIDGDYLRFIRIPPVADLMCSIKLKVLSAGGGQEAEVKALRKKRIEQERFVAKEISHYWMDGSTNNKVTIFRKVPQPHIAIGNISICRDGKDVTTKEGARMLFKEIMK